ncbi:hypothetical protein ElyMa_001050800 [Elysia marginata]|uniref:SMB domain-containing protein n=1 Tax=Elysia marginata TaxID=1093978 RepID=A0AAV4HN85_9GAST|nr:hypothetical protein ElyMa_001050800 [Elysia marginata]
MLIRTLASRSLGRRKYYKCMSLNKFQIVQPRKLKLILLSLLVFLPDGQSYSGTAFVMKFLLLNIRPTKIVVLSDKNVSGLTLHDQVLKKQEHVNSTKVSPKNSRSLGYTQETPVRLKSSVSCEARCGEDAGFPCSCDSKCIVYKTCCKDMAQTCSDLYNLSLAKFKDLLSVSTRCDKMTSVFMVESCPVTKPGESERLDSFTEMLKKNSSLKISKSPTVLGVEDTTLLSEILSNAPVTDYDTGIVYANATIFRCNEKTATSHSLAGLWYTQIGTLDKKVPRTLTGVQRELNMSTYSYIPSDLKSISTGTMCYNSGTLSCINKWSSQLGDHNLICNLTATEYYRLRSYFLIIPRTHERVAGHICGFCLSENQRSGAQGDRYFFVGFKVLISLSETAGNIAFAMHPGSQDERQPVPWPQSWTCDERVTNGSYASCQVLQCDRRFLVAPNGLCRKAVEAEFSIQEKVLYKGMECEIDPIAFADVILSYTQTMYHLKPTNTPFRFYDVYQTRWDINLTAVRMEMYFEVERFEHYTIDLHYMYQTIFSTLSMFVWQHCSRTAKTREENPQTSPEHSPILNGWNNTKEQTFGEVVKHRSIKERPDDIYLYYCFQTDIADSSLDDAIVCDSEFGWFFNIDDFRVEGCNSIIGESQCFQKADLNSKSNTSKECPSPSLLYLVIFIMLLWVLTVTLKSAI